MIEFSIPSDSIFALNLIKEICTENSCLNISTFKVINGIDYNNSFYSKPLDLLFGGGILGAISLNRIKSNQFVLKFIQKH